MPRSTRIMGQKFLIRTAEQVEVPTGRVSAEDLERHGEGWVHEEHLQVLGVCDRDQMVIGMTLDTGWDRFRETFLHENLHAMIAKSGMNNDILHGLEENVVARLSPILLQFVRDNPRALRFLAEKRS